MSNEGAATTYAATAAAGGVSLWVGSLETWLGVAVAGLTVAVLIVRLMVDIPRARRAWRAEKE